MHLLFSRKCNLLRKKDVINLVVIKWKRVEVLGHDGVGRDCKNFLKNFCRKNIYYKSATDSQGSL